MLVICAVTAVTLFRDSIPRILLTENLRHGTNLVNYVGIRFFGGDPSCAGKSTGSTAQSSYIDGELQGHFYVFKDSEHP